MPKTLAAALVMAALLPLPSCKRVPSAEVPPPVARGSCLVNRWYGGVAVDQDCSMGGYAWHCTQAIGDDSPAACTRGPEVGEAPARVVPNPTPADAGANP